MGVNGLSRSYSLRLIRSVFLNLETFLEECFVICEYGFSRGVAQARPFSRVPRHSIFARHHRARGRATSLRVCARGACPLSLTIVLSSGVSLYFESFWTGAELVGGTLR